MIQELARFVAELTLDRIPPRVIEKARLQQMSVIAAGLAARGEAGARKAAAICRPGPVRLFCGGTASLHSAIVANAAATCSSDYDEILLLGHTGHSSVVVPLALADERELPYGRLLVAQIAANEIGARIGLSTFFGPGNGQNLPHLHAASAAAATASILGLDADRTAHALAIALSQAPAPMWPAFLGDIESKILVAARPAEAGATAAELAAQGMRGPLDILEHPRGFYAKFSYLPVRRALGGLGRAWLTDTLEVKLHAACWYFQAALDAAAAILRRTGPLRVEGVKSIRCRTTLLAVGVDALARTLGDRFTANTMNFRLDRSLALLLLAGRLTPAELEHPREPEVRALASKVRIEHDLEESRRTVVGIHRAVDLGGLLGDATTTKLLGALRRARHEYRGMPGPRLGDLPALWKGLRAIMKSRGHAYDLGDHGEAIASLAPECGATLEVELASRHREVEHRSVPEGSLRDVAEARPRVVRKLGRDVTVELEENGSRLLDQIVGRR